MSKEIEYRLSSRQQSRALESEERRREERGGRGALPTTRDNLCYWHRVARRPVIRDPHM